MENKKVLIIPNYLKDNTVDFAETLYTFLENKQYAVYILEENNTCTKGTPDLSQIDFAVILGGDGTILRTARQLRKFNIPLLGINFGHLGYLTECDPDEAFSCIKQVIDGKFQIEERIMLTGNVIRNDECVFEFIGINEAVVYRAALSRALKQHLEINGEYIETITADGIILATPTGSTAYNLSSGGPILTPTSNNLVITPISPQSMPRCSIVTSGNDEIKIGIELAVSSATEDLPLLVIDSKERFSLQDKDRIIIGKSNQSVKIIKVKENSFYQVLQMKLSQARLK